MGVVRRPAGASNEPAGTSDLAETDCVDELVARLPILYPAERLARAKLDWITNRSCDLGRLGLLFVPAVVSIASHARHASLCNGRDNFPPNLLDEGATFGDQWTATDLPAFHMVEPLFDRRFW